MLKVAAIAIFCSLLTACVTAPPAVPARQAETEREVQAASDRFWSAREREDDAAIRTQLTEGAILMIPGLPDADGRDAVVELLQRRFESSTTSGFEVHRREIDLFGDTAYELAWYSETIRSQGESTRMHGRFFTVWKRGTDRTWLIHRHGYNFSGATPVAATSE